MLHLDYFGCWLLEMAKKIEKDLLCALRDEGVSTKHLNFYWYVTQTDSTTQNEKCNHKTNEGERERERKDNQQDLLKKS